MNFYTRFAAFAAITALPFLRYLVDANYSVLRTDSLAAFTLYCIPAVVFAALTRGRGFVVLLAACAYVVSVETFLSQMARLAGMSGLTASLLLGAGIGIGAMVLRERLAPLVTVFSVSFLGAEYLDDFGPVNWRSADSTRSQAHILYVVLDGHIGLAGFPTSIPACRDAQRSVAGVLDAERFKVFENATSNYANTLLSIPSILNARLPKRPDEFTKGRTAEGATIVAPNRMFDEFHRKGYEIEVYQHRSIDYAAGSPAVTRHTDYASEIEGLEYVPGWSTRVWWLAGDYQGASPILSQFRAFLPFRMRFRRTGALATRALWPSHLASDIARAKKPTLFFVHLLIPHEPYVYRADGSVRPPEEWTSDTPVPPLSQSEYEIRFGRYCEQVHALSRQLGQFLKQLRPRDRQRMTVVIHGDHGSRILLAKGDEKRNMINEFSALLAIRFPDARASVHSRERGSVLGLTARYLRGLPVPDDANLVFGVGQNNLPWQRRNDEIWR